MAGASSYPFPSLFLAATAAAISGGGTTPETIKAGQLLLTDRNLNAIASGSTAIDLSTLHVIDAAADKQPRVSAPIVVANLVGPVIYQKYTPYSPLTFTITDAMLSANADTVEGETFITLRVMREDLFTTSVSGNQVMASASYKGNTSGVRLAALTELARQLNAYATKRGIFSAAIVGSDLVLTTLPPKYEEVGSLMTNTIKPYLLFDHSGATSPSLVSSTTFELGRGTGNQIAEMEQSTDPLMQVGRHNPFPQGFSHRANKAGYYNTFTFRFDAKFLTDFLETHERQLTVVAAFPTDASGTVGTQETAFRTALEIAVPKALNHSDVDNTDVVQGVAVDQEDGGPHE